MSIDALDLATDMDSEEYRIRALQAAANAYAPLERPIQRSQSAPALSHITPGISSGVSSISSSNTKPPAVPQFKPQLPPPAKPATENFLIGVVNFQQENQRVTSKDAKLFEKDAKADLAKIDQLTAEKAEAVKRASEELEARKTWDVLSNVAQYIASASAIVLGITCVATGVGTAPGALLIASGGLGLLNRVMHDTHGWEAVVSWFTESKELQAKIAAKIEMGTFLLSLGLGLAGGIWASSAGAFSAIAEGGRKALMTKTGQAIAMGGAFLGAGTKLGSSVLERRIAHLHAQIREIETQMTTRNHTTYQKTTDTQNMLETNQSVTEEVSKGISATQFTFD